MERKFLSILLTLCLMVSLLPAMELTAAAAGDWSYPASDPEGFTLGVDGTETNAGEAANPYAISSAQDLANLAYWVNHSSDYSNKHFALTADIVLNDDVISANGTLINTTSGLTAWTRIGISQTYSFQGTFDGGIYDGDGSLTGCHTISGIYVNDTTTAYYQGLFGYVYGGVVKNVGVVNGYIKATSEIGGICGINYNGTIENCFNSCSVIGTATGTYSYVGGVCGQNKSYDGTANITNCYNTGNVISGPGTSASQSVGGICGRNSSDTGEPVNITYCNNSGTVTGRQYVGGVCGSNNLYGNVTNCYNTGSVSSNHDNSSNLGGVAGCNYGGAVEYCYNIGSVTGSVQVGGVVGATVTSSTMSNCYNTGSVTGSSLIVGGVAGGIAYSSTMSNCYNTGSVTGSDMVGGVAGLNGYSSTMSNCYNTGSVTSSGLVGGVVGETDDSFATDCYYDKQICPLDLGVGTDAATAGMGLTASAMAGASMFSGSEWTTEPDMYPRLADSSEGFDMDGTSEAVLYALPVLLDSGDTVHLVTKNFTVGTVLGASWSVSDNAAVRLVGADATVTGQKTETTATLTATYHDVSRTLALTVPDGVWDGSTVAAEFAGGTGTSDNPYQISNGEELAYLRYLVNTGEADSTNNGGAAYAGLYYELTADIYLGCWQDDGDSSIEAGEIYNAASGGAAYSSSNWTPIGISSAASFTGNFNGNDHTVSGVYINSSTSSHQGLFGYVVGAVINNVNIIDSYILGNGCIGGVAGYAESSTISGCSNAAHATGLYEVGGIAGESRQTTIEYCYNMGELEASVDAYEYDVGGIVGCAHYSGSVRNCYNIGTIYGNTDCWYIGGIAGDLFDAAKMSYCYNAGNIIYGSGCVGVGGVVGERMNSSATMDHCYNIGRILGSNGTKTGGICGDNNGGDSSTVTNCYYDKQMCPIEYGLGSDHLFTDMGILTSEMTGTAMFSDSNWTTETDSYPMLVGMNSTDAALISASPLKLAYTSETEYETADTVKTNFEVSTANSVIWTSANSGVINVSDGSGSIVDSGSVTLTASLNGISKNVVLTVPDSTAPVLTAGSVSRTSAADATVKFTSDEAGTYYSSVVADGADAPSIDTTGAGTACSTSETTITFDSLTAGAKDVYIKVKDAAGNVSDILKIDIAAFDSTAPALTAGSVSRTSDTDATVKFTSDEAGTYYSSVVADGADAPSIDTTGAGTACFTSETTITFDSLTAGAKDVYIKVKDAAGNVSNILKIDMVAYHTSSGSDDTDAYNGASIMVNGESYTAGSLKTTTGTDGWTTTAVTVDTHRLDNILGSEESGATITVPITGNSDVLAGVLTGQIIKNMENKAATLVVKTDSANYTLPASEIDIDGISEQFGTDISLADIKVTVSIAEPSANMVLALKNASAEGGFTVQAPAVDFTISCKYNGQTVNVSSFTSYVERRIAIPDGVDPDQITTAIVVDTDGSIHHVPTQIVVVDGVYYAKINSLTNSTYAIVYNPVEFADAVNHWAKDAINDLGARMVIFGDENGNYNPDNNVTRAEFATIIVSALGLAPGTGHTDFYDVTSADWFNGYVETAFKYGIITGYPDGTFGPNDTITREQAMTMIARAMTITKLNTDLTDGEIGKLLSTFSDGASASAYAKESVAACLKMGITSGTSNTTISPKSEISRAEVAVMVERLLQKSNLI